MGRPASAQAWSKACNRHASHQTQGSESSGPTRFPRTQGGACGRVGVPYEETEAKEQREQSDLRGVIARLETQVHSYHQQLVAWQNRCSELETALQEQVRRGGFKDASHMSSDQVHAIQKHNVDAPSLAGCGNCTTASRCQCLEQAIQTMEVDRPPESRQENSTSSLLQDELNNTSQSHQNQHPAHDPTELETDFTELYARQSSAPTNAAPISTPSSVSPAEDRCGFCQDGTLCICAELERNAAQEASLEHGAASSYAQFTPPPSESDVRSTNTISQPTSQLQKNGSARPSMCNGQPGSCAQCRSDPSSTLFCKALAAARPPIPVEDTRVQIPSGKLKDGKDSSIYLSCADAYTTLSRHAHYEEASDELNQWIGKLRTSHSGKDDSRTAMEIEAASVMGVLKFFDRRFGQE